MSRFLKFLNKVQSSIQKHQEQFNLFLIKSKEEFDTKYNDSCRPNSVLDDFDVLSFIGKGTYGKVFVAKHRPCNRRYAVKAIEKKHVVTEHQMDHLVDEIRILSSVDFEFLIRLHFYFKNTVYVFLVLDYIEGGELFYVLRKAPKFSEEDARFYAGQVVLALEYLHYMGVIYRDLKPENLMLDSTGYLKLVDFGFAKRIGKKRTYTLCGTPEYLAPEMILSQGYSIDTDWWSVGVFIYEMVAGFSPFVARDHWRIYEKITSGRIDWNRDISPTLKSLLQGMLMVDRTKRFGCMKNEELDIKFHKWFSPLDWSALLSKQLTSPHSPLPPQTEDSKVNLRTNVFDEYSQEFDAIDIFN